VQALVVYGVEEAALLLITVRHHLSMMRTNMRTSIGKRRAYHPGTAGSAVLEVESASRQRTAHAQAAAARLRGTGPQHRSTNEGSGAAISARPSEAGGGTDGLP